MNQLFALAKKYLYQTKYIHFFLTGVSGVLINIFFTFIFERFIFLQPSYTLLFITLQDYTLAYIFGTAINLLYNFTLHTKVTFHTKAHHKRRFGIFVLYSVIMSLIQAGLLNVLAPLLKPFLFPFLGDVYYLFIVAGLILAFSVVTFVVFKLVLFKEK